MAARICAHCGIQANPVTFYFSGRRPASRFCRKCTIDRQRNDGYRSHRREYYRLNGDKIRAQAAVSYAVRKGKLAVPTELVCSRCGRQASKYHLDNGYDWQMGVVALCYNCYKDLNRRTGVSRTLKAYQRPYIPGCFRCKEPVTGESFELDENGLPIFKFCKKCKAIENRFTSTEKTLIARRWGKFHRWLKVNVSSKANISGVGDVP